MRRVSPESLKRRLDGYEARFGLPSDRLVEAFRDADGRLHETAEFRDWSMTYGAWKLVTR